MEAPKKRAHARYEDRFGVGYVLAETFAAWFRNLLPFLVIAAIVFSPVIIYNWFEVQSMTFVQEEDVAAKVDVRELVTAVGAGVLASVAAGVYTFGVVRKLQRNPAGLGECLSVGFSRLPAVFGVSLLVGLIVGVVSIPAHVVPKAGLLLNIPVWWVSSILIAAVPSAVIERPGLLGALSRSAELTSGRRGTIFLSQFLLGLIMIVVILVLSVVFVSSSGEASLSVLRTIAIVATAAIVLLGSLQAVSTSVIYHGLRQEKEGVSADELAKVFE